MSDIVKVCKTHGNLTINQVSKMKDSRRPQNNFYLTCKECKKISTKKSIKKMGDSYPQKWYALKRDHGLTKKEYEDMLIKQDNKCAICKKSEVIKSRNNNKIKNLCVDHCHKTDKIRGILCHSCNTSLGGFKDSIEYLKSAILYLKASQLD